MRRFALIVIAALISIGLATSSVSAGKGWCRSDPIVSLNGVELQFWVAIPLENQPDVIGPIEIALQAPRSTNMTLVYEDAGFNGYGELIYLTANGERIAADGSFTVTAKISVPMRGNQFVPMLVEVIPSDGDAVYVEGKTVGVTITLTLRGSTISDTAARAGTVITDLQETTDTATAEVTETATATGSVVATETDASADTAASTESTATDATEEATADPTQEAVDETATDPSNDTSDDSISDPETEGESVEPDVASTPVGDDGEPIADEAVPSESTGTEEAVNSDDASGEGATEEVASETDDAIVADDDAAIVEDDTTEAESPADESTTDESTVDESAVEESTSEDAAGDETEASDATTDNDSQEGTSDTAPESDAAESEETAASDEGEAVPEVPQNGDEGGSEEPAPPANDELAAVVEVIEEVASPPVEPDESASEPTDDIPNPSSDDDEEDEEETTTPTPTPTGTPDDSEPSLDN